MKYIRLFVLAGLLASCIQCQSQLNNPNPMNRHQNMLVYASSPYLLQHAHNPVEWHEWGDEALAMARKENKPLLISIGYAACHWCHVMAHESFEDSTVAAFMNAHFINIKIDREERPDIDQVYMDAAQLISGRGGWPLNAFALPDGRPFYAGTYFPKENWMSLLTQINTLYEHQYEKLEVQAVSVTEGISQHNFSAIQEGEPSNFTSASYHVFFDVYDRMIDYQLGGYQRAPKFPLPVSWELLLQYYYLTQNKKVLQAVENTLDEMAKGGIYDQIGGGFARYSVDEFWKVPHFEKMLYDNGQLVSLYSHAWQVTQNPRYKEVIKQTLGFVERELMSGEGGFYSSLDADSEGEEGVFYTWTKNEIAQVLDENEFKLIAEFFQIQPEGNWEQGKNILHSKLTSEKFAKSHHLTEEAFAQILDHSSKNLLKVRSARTRPGTDDKILTSWNAIMLKGYVDAFRALGDAGFLETALKNARFLEKKMMKKDGSLMRNFKNGKASITAFLDDYATLADGFIQLYQVTFDKHWLDIKEYFIIPANYTTAGTILRYTLDKEPTTSPSKVALIKRFLTENLLEGRLPPDMVSLIVSPLNLEVTRLNEKGDIALEQSNIGHIIVTSVFALLLSLGLMVGVTSLINGLGEEKESRLIEVLFSSVSVRQLLIGKVLALGIAGLLQVLVWMMSTPLILILVSSVSGGSMGMMQIPGDFLVLGITYFILGYLLFAVLSIGIGAISANAREGGQLSMIYTMLSFIPLWFSSLLFIFPDSFIWVVLTLFPATAPIQTILRLGVTDIPLWQILTSIGILGLSILGGLYLSIKIFRMNMLMHGNRPGLRAIFHHLKSTG